MYIFLFFLIFYSFLPLLGLVKLPPGVNSAGYGAVPKRLSEGYDRVKPAAGSSTATGSEYGGVPGVNVPYDTVRDSTYDKVMDEGRGNAYDDISAALGTKASGLFTAGTARSKASPRDKKKSGKSANEARRSRKTSQTPSAGSAADPKAMSPRSSSNRLLSPRSSSRRNLSSPRTADDGSERSHGKKKSRGGGGRSPRPRKDDVAMPTILSIPSISGTLKTEVEQGRARMGTASGDDFVVKD